jgi:drug/metabolite transporter (DMT)-like permease
MFRRTGALAARPRPRRPPAASDMITRHTLLVCGLAMVGFAANSLLARQALGASLVDPSTYTLVRLGSGALALAIWLRASGRPRARGGTWTGGAALAAYAAAFSYSYVRIGAALGALVLFPTVKLALLAWGLVRGDRPDRQEVLGAGVALAGLVALTWPGAAAADVLGIALMMAAGLTWAAYTIAGRVVRQPVAETTGNFARGLLVALPLVWPAAAGGHATAAGLVLAVVSGAVTSGAAYCLWYAVVPRMTAMQAGLAQLTVPAMAMVGAVVLLGEHLTTRGIVAAAAIFGGVGLALVRR